LATPELRDRFVELFKAVKVVRDTVVSLPTPNHACQPATRLAWGIMAAALKLFLDRCQRPTHSRSHRDPLESESLGSACLPAYVRETQEIKRLTLTSAFPFASSRATATKLDQACLRGMKIEAELVESLTERRQASSCVCLMLETDHEVVRVSEDDTIACRMTLSPLVDPQIENVVQKHIRQQR
jgi:hypothetical protein